MSEEIKESVFSSIPIDEKYKTVEQKFTPKSGTFLYQVIIGKEDDIEYYTLNKPEIESDTIYLFDVIQKGVMSEDIFNKTVEVFYKIELPGTLKDITKSLTEGCIITVVNIVDLPWLEKTYRIAEEELKEEKIIVYQSLLPALVNKVKTLEQTLKTKNKGRSNLLNMD